MQGEGGLFDYMLLIVSLFLDLAGLRGVSRAHVYNVGESSKPRRWSSTGGREGGGG